VLVAAVSLVAAAAPVGAHGRSVNCGPAVRRTSSRTEGAPVLFVHGFAGAPSDFRRTLGGRPSMLDVISRARGVVTYTFDYSDHSLEWVTDPAIGDALAQAIVCLAEAHDERVTVIAHSMGGLATKQAQGLTVDGARVSRSLRRVITIGTPLRGAQILGFGGGVVGEIASELIAAALGACRAEISLARAPDRSFCGLLSATETAAVQGMIPRSDELRALARWGRRVRVVPMAADIQLGVDAPFGLGGTFSVGDLAVSVSSATADASPGVRPFVARCHASLFDLVEAIDDSPCSHANEVANRRIVRHVRDVLRRSLAASDQAGETNRSPRP